MSTVLRISSSDLPALDITIKHLVTKVEPFGADDLGHYLVMQAVQADAPGCGQPLALGTPSIRGKIVKHHFDLGVLKRFRNEAMASELPGLVHA